MKLLKVLPILAMVAAVGFGCDGRTTETPIIPTDTLTGSDNPFGFDVPFGTDINSYLDIKGTDTSWIVDNGSPADTNTGNDTNFIPDTSSDVPVQANSIQPIQTATISVECPPAGLPEEPAFTNGAEGGTFDIVITSPRYVVSKDSTTGDPKKYGYYGADATLANAQPWRGAAFTMDVALGYDEFQVGDTLTIVGDHVEYYCFTQIDVTEATKVGTTTVPSTLLVNTTDLGSQDPSRTEAIEGVLVQIRDVTISEVLAYGQFKVDDDVIVGNDFWLDYMSNDTDARTVGQTFDSITGIVKYSYGQYVLMPRTTDDLVFGEIVVPDGNTTDVPVVTDAPVENYSVHDIQTMTSSTTCTEDAIKDQLSNIAVGPVVVVSPQFSASATLHGYYVMDEGAADPVSTGMLVVVNKSLATNFAPGDVLTLQGKYLEYYCLTEFQATAFTTDGTASVPAAISINASLLENGGQNAAAIEPYEGNLVKLTNVTITNAAPTDTKTWFEVGNGIEVRNEMDLTFTPTASATISSLTGFVKYYYGKYRLIPMTDSDIVVQ